MLKSLNLEVINRCNNRCLTCNIWKNKTIEIFDPLKLKDISKKIDLTYIEDLSLTGGEFFLYSKINELMNVIIKTMPSIKMLFINTNGLLCEKLELFIEKYSKFFPQLYVCISLEGKEEIHNLIRGIKSYNTVVSTLNNISKLKNKHDNLNIVISQTISKFNSNVENLEYISKFAKKINATHSFRIAENSENYYKNQGSDFSLSKNDLKKISEFIDINKKEDPFLYLLSKKINGCYKSPMIKGGEFACEAGRTFAFIRSSGKINPCIYFSDEINPEDYSKFKLKRRSKCPCFTECTIYPMLNYGGKSDE